MFFCLVLFDCSERPEIGFLGFRQPLDVRDVHALIWPLAYQCLEAVESLDIPEFDGSIVAACGKGMSTRAESHPPYPVSVPPQGTKTGTSVDIPNADGLILTATGKHISIRAENDCSHPVCMTMEYAQVAPAPCIPYTDGRILASTGKYMAKGAECDHHHSVTTVLHDFETSTGSNIPQANARIFTGACKRTPVRVKGDRPYPVRIPLDG